MNSIKLLLTSSLGKKFLMAITGGALLLFAAGHLVGNLQVFLGREIINHYGYFLHSNPELLWPVRLVLLACVGLHFWSALQLSLENQQARPMGYEGNPVPTAASYASRTMLVSGLIIAAFVIYHLLHYTVRVEAVNFTRTDFAGLKAVLRDGTKQQDVYRMMILGFSQPLVSGFYLLGVGLLCLHLSHGIRAMFQSLGWKDHHWGPIIDRAALLIAWLLFLGYGSIPIAVMLGYGKEVLK